MIRPALLMLNCIVSLASATWGVVAVVQPGLLSGSTHISGGETFYVRMYAARSIPFGMAAAITPFWAEGKAVAWLLFTAGVIQMADVAIGVEKKARGMIIGASFAAIIHVLCGLTVL